MEIVLRGLLWKRCLVYTDNIIVYGKTFDEPNHGSGQGRGYSRQAVPKPPKCELFTKEILYLEFEVSGAE